MSGLFSPKTTTATSTNTVDLHPQQTELLGKAMPYLNKFANAGITLPTGSTVAPFNPTQTDAQSQVLGNVNKMQAGADAGLNASNFTLNPNILSPDSNPGLRGTIDAATRPLFEGLTEQILPSIRGEANTTGNIGSSRQGIAEGLAARGTQNAVGDVGSKIAFSGYQSGMDSMMRSLGLLPQTLTSQNIPGSTMGAIGDANQQMTQQLLDEAKAQFLQKQTLPLDIGKELLNAVSAIPSAGTTGSTNTQGPSLFQQLLGAAATAAGSYFGAK